MKIINPVRSIFFYPLINLPGKQHFWRLNSPAASYKGDKFNLDACLIFCQVAPYSEWQSRVIGFPEGRSYLMIIVVMGVSGCGKSTIGRRVAKALQVPFLEGDDLHSQANILKMKKGIPLTDDDRNPWLKRVAEKMVGMAGQGGGVVACSALKERYRRVLLGDSSFPFLLVYLKGTRDTLFRRLRQRKSHFMPPDLLDSQLKTLEEPGNALTLSIDLSPDIMCNRIIQYAAGQQAS